MREFEKYYAVDRAKVPSACLNAEIAETAERGAI